MGQKNSKGGSCFWDPEDSACFPYARDEGELVFNWKKAAECLGQFRQVLGSVSGLLVDISAASATGLLLTATSLLLKYILETIYGNEGTDQPHKSNNELSVKGSLENALISLKIEQSIVKSAVASLHAKLVAIYNRYSRLVLKDLPSEDRRLEVVPALSLCEEVLHLFSNASHVFYNHPVISAPFVVTFGGIYTAIAELTLTIIPSYRASIVRQMSHLLVTLKGYKVRCIEERVGAVGVGQKDMEQTNMIEGALGLQEGPKYFLRDPFSIENFQPEAKASSPSSSSAFVAQKEFLFPSKKEAVRTLREILERKYSQFFSHILKSVAEFSGFCGAHSQEERDEECCGIQSLS